MEYINLGRTGLKVSRLCLGAMSYGSPSWREWVLDEKASRPFIKHAIERGFIFFDTADMYSNGVSEEVLGRALKDFARRDQVIIGTKVFHETGKGPNDRGLSRKHILDAVDASLRRLRTDYIDLYQIHRWDYSTPIAETLEVLHDVVRSGKVRYIGASSMFAYQFSESLHTAEAHGWTTFVSMQNHYNLVYREEEREMMPLCREKGIAILPWSPLARGFLTGTRKRGLDKTTLRAKTDEYARGLYFKEEDYVVADRVVELSKKKGVTPAQIALAWLLHQDGVTAPIIGATTLSHIDDAIGALTLELDENERAFLEQAYIPHPVLGHS